MNAPTIQRFMNTVFQGLKSFSSCYIDGIVIYSAVWEDHIKGIKEVLERLRQFGRLNLANICLGNGRN